LGLQTFQSAIPAINQRFDLPEHLKINEPYFVIVPGASWAPKMWPVENFAAVAKELSQLCGIKLVLCGTAAEISICQEIERLSGTTAINLAGQTALCDVVEVLNNAQLLIANDSAAIHIATATGTPSICILGGGHYGRFLPYAPERVDSTTVVPDVVSYQMDCYGCNWKCPYLADSRLPIPCVKLIGVDAIILACLRILEKRCGI
jgi:ADP-heptose:LPS heptosyltransferase